MTTPAPMTREELLELAVLDAYGLLEEYEAALFTRSFHHAPAAVQAEIRDLQAAFAADPALLPPVEPDPSLRQRVLEHLHRSIEVESAELAPLAMIGAPRQRGAGAMRARLSLSGQFWRAAALVLAGTVLVVVYFWSDAVEKAREIAALALRNAVHQELRDRLGPFASEYLSARTTDVVLTTADDEAIIARLWIREAQSDLLLYVDGLPADTDVTWTLSYLDEDGTPRQVDSQRTDDEQWFAQSNVEIVSAALAKGVRWQLELIGLEGGTVVLTSA